MHILSLRGHPLVWMHIGCISGPSSAMPRTALAVEGRDPTADMRLMCITEEGAASERR